MIIEIEPSEMYDAGELKDTTAYKKILADEGFRRQSEEHTHTYQKTKGYRWFLGGYFEDKGINWDYWRFDQAISEIYGREGIENAYQLTKRSGLSNDGATTAYKTPHQMKVESYDKLKSALDFTDEDVITLMFGDAGEYAEEMTEGYRRLVEDFRAVAVMYLMQDDGTKHLMRRILAQFPEPADPITDNHESVRLLGELVRFLDAQQSDC